MDAVLAGHYKIIKPLGRGGFGQTYLARDMHLPGNPVCVVKKLRPNSTDPATLDIAKRMFNREAETLYALGNHDQIPRLLAHFEQGGEFFLVQDYINGHPLDVELASGTRLSEEDVTELLQDILQVLAFVHQQQVIHRDIKPSNLMRRNKDNRIVLIDFGAVKQVGTQTATSSGQTSQTVAIGSPGYMPSEQQAFHPHFSSDIYAVGIVCLQALTGLAPKFFPRDPSTNEYSCWAFRDRVTVSPNLAAILDKMVRYDYRQRYRDAIEVLEALLQSSGQDSAFLTMAPFTNAVEVEEPKAIEATEVLETIDVPSKLQNLPEGLKKQLETLLAAEIGPMASVLLPGMLAKATTLPDLIEQLSNRLPEERRSPFQLNVVRLFQTVEPFSSSLNVLSAPQPGGSSPASAPKTSRITDTFTKRCETELAKQIGPIAPVMVKRTLAKNPNVSPLELVDALAAHISDPKASEAFRQSLVAFL